jgi:hypothetical protein
VGYCAKLEFCASIQVQCWLTVFYSETRPDLKLETVSDNFAGQYKKINTMKKILSILLLTFSVTNLLGQGNKPITKINAKSFPTNIQKGDIEELEKVEKKAIAYDGVISKIENSRNNTPFYKLKISEDNYLWTVLMFKNDINKIGDKIRVVGYLIPAEPDASEKQYLDTKYMVIAFGLVDFENSNVLMVEGKQKQEWIDGKIPSSN